MRSDAPDQLWITHAPRDRYPIERLFRDQHALSANIGFRWDAQGGPWALVALGGDFVSPTM